MNIFNVNVQFSVDLNCTFVPFKSIGYVNNLSMILAKILNKFKIHCKITCHAPNRLKQIFSLRSDHSDNTGHNFNFSNVQVKYVRKINISTECF